MITSVDVSLHSTVNDVCRAASAANLDGKSWNEFVWAFEALSRWKDVLQARFGDLATIDHHSPPDDPPDLMLHFATEAGTVGTYYCLKPYPFGWADALRGRRGGFVPPVTTRTWTRAELENVISGATEVWEDASEALRTTFRVLKTAVDKKIERLTAGGIVVVEDRVTFDARERESLIRALAAQTALLPQHGVIIFQRNNALQFWSTLLGNNELLVRQSDIFDDPKACARWLGFAH